MGVGNNMVRVDAIEKVTGGAKYTADLEPKGLLVAKVVRSTIANGVVKSFDLEAALAVPGVVKIVLRVLTFRIFSSRHRDIPGLWRPRTRILQTESC